MTVVNQRKVIISIRHTPKVQVPGFTWHTYVMTSDLTIIFETMVGVYNPLTWKKIASWAPDENSDNSIDYLNNLKKLKI